MSLWVLTYNVYTKGLIEFSPRVALIFVICLGGHSVRLEHL